MSVKVEAVNAGHYLVDCSVCGNIGVWPSRHLANGAKTKHVCGRPSPIPGKWGIAAGQAVSGRGGIRVVERPVEASTTLAGAA